MQITLGSYMEGQRSRYKIVGKIAEGGMGYVYDGVSDEGQRVVVKAPKPVTTVDYSLIIEKLRVEAQILRSLSYQNIVKYVDERDEQSNFYLVTEYVEGPNMKDNFWGRPALEEAAKRYSTTLLGALSYLHGLNIVYRDMKPQNVLLEPARQLVLIDFGAAKQGYVQLLGPGTIIGTTGWSAPEQFTRGLASPTSDIYAAGAVLFFLLTGQEPRIYMAATGALVKPPHDINTAVSREISNVVATAMDPEPSKRYQTATDMINAMQGRSTIFGAPHIILGGSRHPISGAIKIGRAPDCDICITDPQKYISKYHAKVYFDGAGRCWVEDLGSLNGTAVASSGGGFQLLPRQSSRALRDGDIVALAYNPLKGPYITFTYRSG